MGRAADQLLPNPSNAAKPDRRQEVPRVAFDVFAEKRYSGTTMLEIAQRAHASKETLFDWFQNKAKLFETLILARLSEIIANLPKQVEQVEESELFLLTFAAAALR
jgi:AcrR family transcriptional regulator